MFPPSCRFRLLALSITAIVCSVFAPSAPAPIVNKTILKAYFQTGDTPTEEQFSNFIDSMINFVDDDIFVIGVLEENGKGALMGEGTEVGPEQGLSYIDVSGLSEAWVGQSGYLGLQLEIDSSTHFGYLQITAAPDDQYPMFVKYLVYEDVASVPITTSIVPEPTALVLAVIGLFLLAVFRRGRRHHA